MVSGLWGKKIGMTQIFANDKVVPVTLIDTSSWIVVGVKTVERDGYAAVQVGCVKDRYRNTPFSSEWTKKPRTFFSFVREVKVSDATQEFVVGSPADFMTVLAEGDHVDTTAMTKGKGFCGVIRRHNFNGPPGSHGSDMGRKPGSVGAFRAEGRVIKGKRLPGQTGNKQKLVRGLKVVKIEADKNVLFVKGAVPGKSGSLIFVRKA